MGRIVLSAVLTATLVGGLAVAATAGSTGSGAPAPAAFRLGDGSVACAFDGERLACRAHDGSSAIVLEPDGRSQADDVEVASDASTPVLLRAQSWWHGGFGCHVDDTNVVCERGAGSMSVGPAGAGGAASAASP